MRVNSLHWYAIEALGAVGDIVTLLGDEWHHCFNVMRMREGDCLILCNGKGLCMEGIIRSASVKNGLIELAQDHSEQYKNSRAYKVSIGLALTKNIDRLEFAVEKLVEIGIDEIIFLDCDHNERSHLRLDRVEKIAIAAAKQSKKTIFPVLHDLISPAKLLEKRKSQKDVNQVLACHLDADSKSIAENYLPGKDVLLLVGPEGGFSTDEMEEMKSHQVKFVHLGPFRLRVETAAIVACADIHLIQQMKT